MTLSTLHAALIRVEKQIVAAPNSVARDALLAVRASVRDQIHQMRGAPGVLYEARGGKPVEVTA